MKGLGLFFLVTVEKVFEVSGRNNLSDEEIYAGYYVY
jgi:hypothetical protein